MVESLLFRDPCIPAENQIDLELSSFNLDINSHCHSNLNLFMAIQDPACRNGYETPKSIDELLWHVMAADDHFHHFCRLPTELRLKIWSFALSDTRRLIKIQCTTGVHPNNTRYVKAYTSVRPVPAILHVNQESRSEALAIYKPHFKTRLRPTGIYVSFDRDTIFLSDRDIGYLQEPELQGIRFMILELADVGYLGYFNLELLRSMRRLETLELRVDIFTLFNQGEDFVARLIRELRVVKEFHAEWEMPSVMLVDKWKGKVVVMDKHGKREVSGNLADGDALGPGSFPSTMIELAV